MADIARLELRVESSGVEKATKVNKTFVVSLEKSEREAKQLDAITKQLSRTNLILASSELRASNAVKKNTDSLKKQNAQASKNSGAMGALAKRILVAGAAYMTFRTALRGVNEITQATDKINLLESRLDGITESTEEFTKVYSELRKISGEVGVGIAENINLYQSLKRAADDLGASNEQVLELQEAYNKLGVISGASAEALKFSMRQFTQAMAGGILRAEEFNSIVENTPEIAASIAKGMKLTVGQLRLAVIQGKVLSKDVFDSLLSQTDEVNERFAALPRLVEQARVRLDNAWTKFIADSKIAQAISRTIAESIDNTARILEGTKSIDEVLASSDLNDVLFKRGQLLKEIEAIQQRNFLTQKEQNELAKKSIDFLKIEKRLNDAIDADSFQNLVNREQINKSIADQVDKARLGYDAIQVSLEKLNKPAETLEETLERQVKESEELKENIESGLVESVSASITEFEKLHGEIKKTKTELGTMKLSEEVERTETLKTERERGTGVDAFFSKGMSDEEEELMKSYERRKQIIKDSTFETETEKQELLSDLAKERGDMERTIEGDNLSKRKEAYGQLQDDLLVLAKSGSKEALAVYKAAAIAETIMTTWASAQKAFDALAWIPTVGPALGAAAAAVAVAAGMARVSAIKNTEAGNFEAGGIVGGNSYSGDRLTANVNSSEMVINRSQQKELFDIARGRRAGGAGNNTIVNVQNNSGQQASVTESIDGINRIVDIKIGEFKRNIASGGNQDSRLFETTFGMQRASVRR